MGRKSQEAFFPEAKVAPEANSPARQSATWYVRRPCPWHLPYPSSPLRAAPSSKPTHGACPTLSLTTLREPSLHPAVNPEGNVILLTKSQSISPPKVTDSPPQSGRVQSALDPGALSGTIPTLPLAASFLSHPVLAAIPSFWPVWNQPIGPEEINLKSWHQSWQSWDPCEFGSEHGPFPLSIPVRSTLCDPSMAPSRIVLFFTCFWAQTVSKCGRKGICGFKKKGL